MAEHANDGFLLYLLDMAILEANRRARAKGEGGAETVLDASVVDSDGHSPREMVTGLKVVR